MYLILNQGGGERKQKRKILTALIQNFYSFLFLLLLLLISLIEIEPVSNEEVFHFQNVHLMTKEFDIAKEIIKEHLIYNTVKIEVS